jgi:hypothetical protein
MPAECWACALGLTRVGGKLPGQHAVSSDPLGVCFDCRVFGCAGHAERQTNSGKWYCYPTVTKALAAQAGLADEDETATVRFDSAEDFQRQFPRLASQVAPRLARWRGLLQRSDAVLGPDDTAELAASAGAALDLLSGPRGRASAAARDIGLTDLETAIREAGE